MSSADGRSSPPVLFISPPVVVFLFKSDPAPCSSFFASDARVARAWFITWFFAGNNNVSIFSFFFFCEDLCFADLATPPVLVAAILACHHNQRMIWFISRIEATCANFISAQYLSRCCSLPFHGSIQQMRSTCHWPLEAIAYQQFCRGPATINQQFNYFHRLSQNLSSIKYRIQRLFSIESYIILYRSIALLMLYLCFFESIRIGWSGWSQF